MDSIAKLVLLNITTATVERSYLDVANKIVIIDRAGYLGTLLQSGKDFASKGQTMSLSFGAKSSPLLNMTVVMLPSILHGLSLFAYQNLFSLEGSYTFIYLFLSYTFSSQITLPLSSYLLAYEMTKINFYINFVTFVFSLFTLFTFLLIQDKLFSMQVFVFLLVATNIIRYFLTHMIINRTIPVQELSN